MSDFTQLLQCFDAISVSHDTRYRHEFYNKAPGIDPHAYQAIEVQCTTFWFTAEGLYLGCVNDENPPSWECREDVRIADLAEHLRSLEEG